MIDERTIIDPEAKISEGVSIGPWTMIGPDVEIGPHCQIGPHVVLKGPTKIGARTKIFQFASVGDDPQDKKYNGERTFLEVGEGNIIREFCTINRGTVGGGGLTRIGNDNLFMAYVHVAHDCIVADRCVFANHVTLAGHVEIGNDVIMGGFSGVHQFCKLGAHCFIAKATYITQDVMPYLMVAGYDATTHGLNSEGLRRRGFSEEEIRQLKQAYKIIFRKGLTIPQAINELASLRQENRHVNHLVEQLQQATRGVVR